MSYVFGYLVVVLVFQNILCAPPSPTNVLTYDIYEVEHAISSVQAKNASQSIDLDSVNTPLGCQMCTNYEIRYCLGSDFINDHCCCDKRYHEVLPYIPHTCYIGSKLCKPIAGDCIAYQQLRACCCNFYLLKKWSSKATLPLPMSFLSIMFIFKSLFVDM